MTIKEEKEGPDLTVNINCGNCKHLGKVFDTEEYFSETEPIFICNKLKRVLHKDESLNLIRCHSKCPFSEKIINSILKPNSLIIFGNTLKYVNDDSKE